MKNVYALCICTLFSFCHMSTFGQSNVPSDSKLEDLLNKGKYSKVIDYYNVDREDRLNEPLRDYYLGVAYFNTPEKKAESKSYLENYVNSTSSEFIEINEHYNAYYLLAKMYHLTYDFDSAEMMYAMFIDITQASKVLPKLEKNGLKALAEREIEQCANGRVAVNNPRRVIIENLGDTINTAFPEYAAVVSHDEKRIIFTSRRPDSTGGKKVKKEGYYEDIYSANLDYGSLFEEREIHWNQTGDNDFSIVTDFSYSNLNNLGDRINSSSHDASIQLSNDESLLYFYRDSDIWSVDISSDSISSEPRKLGIEFNSSFHEPSIYLSSDTTKMFIVSDMEGGYGGLDIYMCELMENGKWSLPLNLGQNVNTPYDEDAPYLDPDNKTLYYASDGHSSIGGFDIFRSKLNGFNGSPSINLGYPINTTADDIYFTMTTRYNRGYYSSSKLEGKGGMDIYRISFADERDPVAELKGFIKKGEHFMPAKSQITMTSLDGLESIVQQSKSTDGSYYFLLGTGKSYSMSLETEGFVKYDRVFDIPEQQEYYRLFQEIHHVHIRNSKGEIIGQQITMYNSTGEENELTEGNEILDRFGNVMENVDAFTETKFYITEDSLIALMSTDKGLNFDLGKKGIVKYINHETADKMDENSYEESETESDLVEISMVRRLGVQELIQSNETSDQDELFFSVQLGAFSSQLSDPKVISDIHPLYTHETKEWCVVYYSNKTQSYNDAQVLKQKAIDSGIEDAFVTAYYKGERVTTRRALEIIYEKDKGNLLGENQ